jgi:hypothetical protein
LGSSDGRGAQGTLLQEQDDRVECAYFPLSGMIPLLAVMGDGQAIETAIVGREGALLQRATGTSVQEIENLITELQTLRDTLQSEAARVQREIVEYTTLSQGGLASRKPEKGRATRNRRSGAFRSILSALLPPNRLPGPLHEGLDLL